MTLQPLPNPPEEIDWNQTNTAIGRQIHRSSRTVARYRHYLGMGQACRGRPVRDCSGWNWNLPNSDLARIHGASLPLVNYHRRKYGSPAIPLKQRGRR